MKSSYLLKIYNTLLSEGVIFLSNESWTMVKNEIYRLVGEIPIIVGFNEVNPDIVRVELMKDF